MDRYWLVIVLDLLCMVSVGFALFEVYRIRKLIKKSSSITRPPEMKKPFAKVDPQRKNIPVALSDHELWQREMDDR